MAASEKNIKEDNHPFREMLSAILCQIQSRHSAQFDTQGLQEDGEQIGDENNEEQGVSVLSTGRNIGGIVSGVDVGNGNQKTRSHEAGKIDYTPGHIQEKRTEEKFLERTAR